MLRKIFELDFLSRKVFVLLFELLRKVSVLLLELPRKLFVTLFVLLSELLNGFLVFFCLLLQLFDLGRHLPLQFDGRHHRLDEPASHSFFEDRRCSHELGRIDWFRFDR